MGPNEKLDKKGTEEFFFVSRLLLYKCYKCK